jgi:uncharacterized damage-inducible protein DinB
VTETRARLEHLRSRLRTTLQRMSPEDLAWRPNAESNSAGNLVGHICGNLRQRFVAGFGGAPDTRERDAEFLAQGPWTAEALIAEADAALGAVDAFLAGLDPARLSEVGDIQGRSVRLLELLVQTVAHTSEHVGQIMYIAKERQGERFASLSLPRPRRA